MGSGNHRGLRLRDRSLEWRSIDGDVVAVDLKSSEYLHLNRSRARLWAMRAVGATVVELCQHRVDAYGLRWEAAVTDVRAYVSALDARELLEA